jgi:hypothetical protein
LAYVRSNLFYFNFFASSNPILLATGFYDRVHVDLFNLDSADLTSTDVTPRTNFRRAKNYSTLHSLKQIKHDSTKVAIALSIQFAN